MMHTPKVSSTDGDYSIPGFRIQEYGPDRSWPLVVWTAMAQRDWFVRDPEMHLEDRERIPTTILYKGAAYAIARVDESEGVWVYRMAPWPEHEIWYRTVELSPEGVATRISAEKAAERLAKWSRISPFYEAFIGWLPASVQEALSHHWHFSTSDASRKNALLELFMGLYLYFLMMTYGDITLFKPSLFCVAEGLLRWLHVSIGERPCGEVILEIAAWILRRVAAALAGTARTFFRMARWGWSRAR